ncbi:MULTISPECIES: hypothetical protein [Pseudomonas]|nr:MULTISPECIES: hypothetical protein [Pseudomonas]MBF8638031.1 hypothetical protein [Pseudomonas fulva]MBF8689957.1 hypothetical protein [Pseudomonas fulva]MEB8058671.1 hypothetical protein [Pseudomonas fulva]
MDIQFGFSLVSLKGETGCDMEAEFFGDSGGAGGCGGSGVDPGQDLPTIK